jgi:hypothetical protein
MPDPFRRLNFFKGLFTTASDWKDEQSYHVRRLRLHNTQLHIPGIVSGLDVKPSASGVAVQIAAGHAIDAQGRDVHLDHDVQINVPFDDYAQPTELLVVVEYEEKYHTPRDNAVGGKENALVEEGAKASLGPELPPNALPLAKIRLTRAAERRVHAASDAANPKDNEIDLRVRQRAGSLGAKPSLRDMGTVAQAGEIDLGPRKDGTTSQYEATVTWSAEGEGHTFHFASVYPVDTDGEVSWWLGCVRQASELKYKLFIRNHERKGMRVSFRVYRVD